MPRKEKKHVKFAKKDETIYHDYKLAMENLTGMYPDIPQPVLYNAWKIWYASELDSKKKELLNREMEVCPVNLNTMDQWKDVKTEFKDCVTVNDEPPLACARQSSMVSMVDPEPPLACARQSSMVSVVELCENKPEN